MTMSKVFKSLSLFIIALFTLSSCLKTDEKNYEANEQSNINNYLSANPTLLFEQKESGLYYFQETAGSGDVIGANDTAYVSYSGEFLNGYQFDSTTGTDTYKVLMGSQSVIPGFEEAISYMREGGKSICIVPSKLAYGRYGYQPYIPGYTPLVFEISLKKIGRAAQ